MRHNDYPATLLMEQPEPEERSRYRMRMSASTKRGMLYEPTSAELTAAEDYWHACHMFEAMDHDVPPTVVSFHPGDPPMGTLAELAATESASGAALIGTKTEPEAEVWHTEAPTVPGVYLTRLPGGDSTRPLPSWWCGQQWHLRPVDPHLDPRKTDPCYGGGAALVWLRLIEADTPAAPAAHESGYLVCIKGSKWLKVGQIAHQVGGGFDPEYWARCDSEGWISHQPTADDACPCPVPNSLMADLRFRGAGVQCSVADSASWMWSDTGGAHTIVAWRPIQA